MKHKSHTVSSVLENVLVLFSDCFVQLFATPFQAFLSFTIFQSLLKLLSIKVGDAIQPSQTPSPPSPPAFSLSQHQALFQ